MLKHSNYYIYTGSNRTEGVPRERGPGGGVKGTKTSFLHELRCPGNELTTIFL